jgi:hypothetical protein
MNGEHTKQLEARTEEKRVATEWATADIRIHREGNLYQMELSVEGPGETRRYFVKLDEDVANGLGDIWLSR